METPSESESGTGVALYNPGPTEVCEARLAREALEVHHSDDLPRLVSLWIASFKSPNTRRSYVQGFKRWDAFCRSVNIHPLQARRPHVESFMRDMEAQGVPDTTQAHALSTASSFYQYAITLDVTDRNPLQHVRRPKIDPDYSNTEGLTDKEMARLIEAARQNSARSYALVLLLYTLGLRVNGALAADVTDLGYDKGHRVLTYTKKGGTLAKLPIPPITADALDQYLQGRTKDALFITRSGARMAEPEVWKMLRRLAKRAGLPQADTIHPHVLRHGFITDALERKVPLHIVQDAVGHADPRTTQRYNRARGRLDGHPAYAVADHMAGLLEDRKEES